MLSFLVKLLSFTNINNSLFIEEQNKKRQTINYKDDLKKIEYLTIDTENPFDPLKTFKTEEGKHAFKLKLLTFFWENKNKYMKYIIILYCALYK